MAAIPVGAVDLADPGPMKREARKVLASGLIGSSIEFYDFLLYGTAAALVFAPVFFANLPTLVGQLAAFGTFATGYLARPLGGVIFGHFGDRIGRKRMLFVTIIMMGLSSMFIGCLPTPATIGIAAPILLVVLRLIQGVALGGEWGGAMLMAVEYAAPNRRGFYSTIVSVGSACGNLIASGVLAIFTSLPHHEFLAWGWRVPFLLSAVLLIVGVVVRATVKESPLFLANRHKSAPPRVPLFDVLRRDWRVVLVAAIVTIAPLALYITEFSFIPAYAARVRISVSEVLTANTVYAAVAILMFPVVGALTDRYGRKPVMTVGYALGVVGVYPMFLLIGTGHAWGAWLALFIGDILINTPTLAPLGAYISEQFRTESRYTGASLGYQLGTAIGSGLTPLAITSILAASSGASTVGVAVFIAAVFVPGLVLIAGRRETSKLVLAE